MFCFVREPIYIFADHMTYVLKVKFSELSRFSHHITKVLHPSQMFWFFYST